MVHLGSVLGSVNLKRLLHMQPRQSLAEIYFDEMTPPVGRNPSCLSLLIWPCGVFYRGAIHLRIQFVIHARSLSDLVFPWLRGSDTVFSCTSRYTLYPSSHFNPPFTTMSVPPKFAGLKLSAGSFQKTQHTLEMCEFAFSIYAAETS